MSKLRGLRFLPGGTGKYVETLQKSLEFVDKENPEETRLKHWFLEQYPQTHSEKAVEKYIHTIKNQLGLITKQQGKFTLTSIGKEYLATNDNKVLFRSLNQRIEGIREILVFLQTPKQFSEIHTFLSQKYGWKTNTQTYIRLGWLQSMGYMTKTENTYNLTELGKAITVESQIDTKTPQPKVQSDESPNHNGIRDMIGEIGKFEGWFSEVEYPMDKMRLDVVWRRIAIGNPCHVFEVQVGGNFYEALTKLKHAYDKWNSQPFLVTTEKYEQDAQRLLEGSFHEIQHVTKILNWKKIKEFHEIEKKRCALKSEIGLA